MITGIRRHAEYDRRVFLQLAGTAASSPACPITTG